MLYDFTYTWNLKKTELIEIVYNGRDWGLAIQLCNMIKFYKHIVWDYAYN